jgi:DUF1365 family protein
MAKPWLYIGRLVHMRQAPAFNSFSYPAFFICFPLREKAALASRCFSLNRFNLFSFHDADYGDGAGDETWARNILQAHGIEAAGEIWLHTLPRMLGFVFNPVSFWLCHDTQGQLHAVISEVRNTFGERHSYLLEAEHGAPITADTELRSRKVFHVSPFFEVSGEYHFRFRHTPGRRSISIDYWNNGALALKTAISGDVQPLTDRNLVKLFFSLGWSTLLVVLRIHRQALLIWLKGVPFHKKPMPPKENISR